MFFGSDTLAALGEGDEQHQHARVVGLREGRRDGTQERRRQAIAALRALFGSMDVDTSSSV